MPRLLGLLALALLAHCAEPPPPRSPAATEAPPPVQSAAASPAAAPAPAPSPTPPRAAPDAGVPPLSTPNAPASARPDAGADAEPPPGDPRTAGIRRIALAAQDCHARHAPGIKGRLTLRLSPDHTGAVTRASVVRADSSPELARPAFESCVLEAAKKERLSPARDEDDEVELPLTFEPNP